MNGRSSYILPHEINDIAFTANKINWMKINLASEDIVKCLCMKYKYPWPC